MGQSQWTIRARWIFPISSPPIERGIITIADDRIVGVSTDTETKADYDFGDAAILPGLVNAHTHLDLSDLRGRFAPGMEFTDWLRAVALHRRIASLSESEAAVRAGLEESLAAGTTLIGDIASSGLSSDVLSCSPLRAVVFYELIGLTRTRSLENWERVLGWLRDQHPSPTYRPGLSPHAPYTLRQGLFAFAAMLSYLPLSIHLAETLEEETLLRTRSGRLRKLLEELDAWDEVGLVNDLRQIIDIVYAWRGGAAHQAAPVLFIHGNYLPRDLWPSIRYASIVYCPRTHRFFDHAPHPVSELLQSGINVCLGTDSLASNPDLSILGEMRYLWRERRDLSPEMVLRMGTLAGATALGWQNETGCLTPGKSADFAVIPLKANGSDPYELLLDSSESVSQVCVRGRWLERSYP